MRRYSIYKSRDRGPLEFKSKLRREEGTIMRIAKRDVITIPPSLPIKDAAERMVKHGVRRLPVTGPGTKRLEGTVVTRDILDFLGGGNKHLLVQKKFRGNFLAAMNEGVREIMNPNPPCGNVRSSIAKVAALLLKTGVGGVPILDDQGRVVGIVTERDFVHFMPSHARTKVEGHMTRQVVTATPELSIGEATKQMISKGFRRLPVVDKDRLVGIVTSVDVLRYFGTSKMFEHMASGRVEEAMAVGVSEVMSRDLASVEPEADLGEAVRIMAEHDYGGLPVVTDGRLVGIITERDLLELLA